VSLGDGGILDFGFLILDFGLGIGDFGLGIFRLGEMVNGEL
jgi:hypothetical protein